MIYPSISELSDKGVNRYILSIATAKCARKITDEQLERTQAAQEAKDEKFASFSSKKPAMNEKPVKEAILRLYSRDFKIVLPENK
jgi:DNA-directed RNA polymerase subunit K/omega